MKRLENLFRGWHRFSPVGLASFGLVAAGLLLGAVVDMAWLILFALGVFGPVFLREVGLLRDRDEFQRQAAFRAGYRAYLVGGVFLAGVLIAKSWGYANLEHDQFPAHPALTVLVMVYFLSYLTDYWGVRKAAFRILLAFGLLWLVFALLEAGPLGFLRHPFVVLPFFVLAITSRRWPRISGGLLIALSIFAFFFFHLHHVLSGSMGALSVLLVLFLPLLYSGIALLSEKQDEEG